MTDTIELTEQERQMLTHVLTYATSESGRNNHVATFYASLKAANAINRGVKTWKPYIIPPEHA
jgi:hypothetical protein